MTKLAVLAAAAAFTMMTWQAQAAPVAAAKQIYQSNAVTLVANGCVIEGRVENSVLFRGVRVHRGAQIRNSIVMQKSEIGVNAVLESIICDKDVKITDGKRLMGDKNYVMVIEKGMVV